MFAIFISVPAAAQNAGAKKKPAASDDDLPPVFDKYEDLKDHIPTVETLLTEKPVDWIVLKNDDVVITEPVYPRPETLKKIAKRIVEEPKKWPKPKNQEERLEQAEKRKDLHYIEVTVPMGGANQEKRIHSKHIREIIHHEDLLLRRIAILQDKGNFPLAFELLFNLKRKQPNWPTIAKYGNRGLLVEARRKFAQKKTLIALVKIEELYSRDKKFPQAKPLLGEILDRMINKAYAMQDYRRARHYIRRLYLLEPEHKVYVKWRDQLSARATVLLNTARKAAKENKHDLAAETVKRAVDIWPQTPGLQGEFEQMVQRFQTLRVGVMRFAGEKSNYFLPTLDGMRQKYLTQTPLFEAQGVDDVVHYQTRYFTEWEPIDLGRRAILKLSGKRPYFQPQPQITAADIADTLRARLDPKNTRYYDERLAAYVKSYHVESPTRLQIRFKTVPPRLESILNFPLIRMDSVSGDSANRSQSSGGSGSVISPRFSPYRSQSWSGTRRAFRRHLPEPNGVPGNRYHVAEVVETKFDTHENATRALKRGQIHMIAHLRTRDVDEFAQDKRFDVRRYALPITHVLQFNPNSETLKSRELRQSIRYALNRPQMLRDIILEVSKGGNPQHGRLVSAPFPLASYAYFRSVTPRKYDLTLALALKIIVDQLHKRAGYSGLGAAMGIALESRLEKIGSLPVLRMVIPPGKQIRAVAEKCILQWDRIGLRVKIVDPAKNADGTIPGGWDIIYRTVKMVDPVVDLWPFLTLENRARVESLKHFPDWLRQELIQLDVDRDWNTVIKTLHGLHRHLAVQARLVPLWEVDDFLVTNVKQVDAFRTARLKPVYTYQGIERWRIKPLLPDPP
ncbi:MAG: hypothetical protein IID45_02525 [Planctomycetes bacterium]|nr:hypothetical protein [Planctomycetota bacterium]